MPNIFVISDTWFNRPDGDDQNLNVVDYNQNIVMNWNSVVKKTDIVYVLGGFGIGDLYHLIITLNGKIHFLNNAFNEDEKNSIDEMKNYIDKSYDKNLKNRIFFETNQILVLKDIDVVLSYYPLVTWSGKSTGTYCFHGLTDLFDIYGHSITSIATKWEYTPVNIMNIKNNIDTFKINI